MRFGRALIAASVMLAVASTARVARAEPDDERPADEAIVPPRLVTAVSPSYPDDAEGDAYVVVVVTVAASGAVDAVRAIEGASPFVEKAIEAMGVARFIPATRGGKAIASTVKFRLDFKKVAAAGPPPPAPPAPVPGPEKPPAGDTSNAATGELPPPDVREPPPPEGEAPADATSDVTVRGGKGSVGAGVAETLARTEVRQLPGAFGDPFRAIEISPGFTPIVSGLPYFYVRGAPPGNVGYYFDGVRVPYLFHFGLGPAVIQPSLIARTDIHKGGYPAALGRYAGGIVDATSMPPSDRFHGEGQLRLIDAGGLVEVPFAKGRGSVLLGGRYSYTAALFSLVRSDTSLDYRDYQARIAYALGDRDVLSLLIFGAYDHATQRTEEDANTLAAAGVAVDPNQPGSNLVDRVLFASEFHRVDARWDHAFSGGAHMRAAATVGFDRTRLESRRDAEDVMTGLRFDLVAPITKNVLFRGGADIVADSYDADALPRFAEDDDVVARQQRIFVTRTDYATGVRADVVLTPLPGVEVVPGLRLDLFQSGGVRAVGIDPRLAARFAVSKNVRIVHANGLATQPPSTPLALPAFTIARLDGGLQRSAQTSAGVEVDLPEDITATATLFHHAFFDLNDALGTAQIEIIDIEKSDSLVGKSRGAAFGLELGIRRKLTRRLGGLVAYTLSRSNRTADSLSFISAYDRTHVFNAALSYDLGRKWRAGGRVVFYTGIPFKPFTPEFPGQVIGIPPERTPPFFRIDLRLEKRWTIGKAGWVSFAFEMLNATFTSEVNGYRCGRSIQLPGAPRPNVTCNERVIGPIAVPSLGVEGGF